MITLSEMMTRLIKEHGLDVKQLLASVNEETKGCQKKDSPISLCAEWSKTHTKAVEDMITQLIGNDDYDFHIYFIDDALYEALPMFREADPEKYHNILRKQETLLNWILKCAGGDGIIHLDEDTI